MTTDFRRHWQVGLAVLLIWGSAGLLGSVGRAADDDPAQASDAEAQAIADRFDAMLERAAAQVGAPEAGDAEPESDVQALRDQLEAAETQIRLLKNVVIQALRAQNAAEAELRRERVARETVGVARAEATPEPVPSPDPMLAEQVAALQENVRRLRADVDALRRRSPGEPAAGPDADGALEQDESGMETGMGGEYEPLLEDEKPAAVGSAAAAVAAVEPAAGDDAMEVAQVLFDTGSAELSPGAVRRTREALGRIRSMGAAKVRVVGYTDRVGDAASNLVLSKQRALSVAAVLERVGLARDMVEVVGNGEDDLPVPTPNGVPEPLNRCAGIFVIRASAG